MKYSIVIPVHNEEENVAPLCEALAPVARGLGGETEIVFVDDGSTDRTFDHLAALAAKTPLVIVRLARRSGLASALQAGFDASLGAIVITLDGDGQQPPADIPAAIAKLEEGFDAVFGCRERREDPASKRAASRAANALRQALFAEKTHDVGCSLRALRRPVLERVRLRSGLHRFFAAMCAKAGFRVAEIPVRHEKRLRGKSKFGFWGRLFEGTRDLGFVLTAPGKRFASLEPAYAIREIRRA